MRKIRLDDSSLNHLTNIPVGFMRKSSYIHTCILRNHIQKILCILLRGGAYAPDYAQDSFVLSCLTQLVSLHHCYRTPQKKPTVYFIESYTGWSINCLRAVLQGFLKNGDVFKIIQSQIKSESEVTTGQHFVSYYAYNYS